MESVTFSVVIPTCNRPDSLSRCVDSLTTQSRPPTEVIIVDDGDLPKTTRQSLRETLPESTALTFTRSRGEAGLCAARNRGVTLASEPIVLFLDDDVELGTDYLQHLYTIYKEYDDPDLAGVGGFDDSHRRKSTTEAIFNRIFRLGNGPWQINRVGFESIDPNMDGVTEADWLSGYNSSYKRDVLKQESFEQHEGGRETLDDIELGWRLATKGYYFLIDPNLKIIHHDQSITDSPYDVGAKRGRNRVRIFYKHGSTSDWPLFIWCMIGDTAKHILAPLINGRSKYHLSVALGMIIGSCQMLFLNILQKKIAGSKA